MVTGGHDYELEDVLAAAVPARMPSGVRLLDEHTGGIEPGALWAVNGPSGAGVTTLVLTIAAAAAAGGADVIVCNGHVPSVSAAARLSTLCDGAGRPRHSTWYPLLLDPPAAFENTAVERAALLIVDTWDETWHATPWPQTRASLTRRLRWLRHLARTHQTALVLTARSVAGPSDDVLGWLPEAFDDAADVHITLSEPPDAELTSCRGWQVGVRDRGRGHRYFRYPATGVRTQFVRE